jgi:basic membrane lipoprotein Med (substrate-binding protein (PBP1-ABC) superfamily)
VVQSFIGNWEDVGAAKEATLALIARGADFIFQNADAAGLGVFQAVQEQPGIYAFGSNKNQNSVAPRAVLASAVLDIPQAFITIARRVKEKTFKAEIMRMGMEEGVVALEINPGLQDLIAAAVMAKIEAGKQGIISGQIEVPIGF